MKAKKTTKFTAEYLDKLIEEATTDAYNESEQAGGFFAMIEEHLSLPFTTQVLGQAVTWPGSISPGATRLSLFACMEKQLRQFRFSICRCRTRRQRERNG